MNHLVYLAWKIAIVANISSFLSLIACGDEGKYTTGIEYSTSQK